MRVRTVLAVTAFTATAVLGSAGLASADQRPAKCIELDETYTLPVNKLVGQATEFVFGKEGREAFVDQLFCVGAPKNHREG